MTYEEFKQMLESASENINKTGRLIEFRGKQKNTKEWCFGFYTPAFNEKGEVFPAIASISIAELLYEPVIPETIGQYTGLTDKNGKKIFEGDILAYCDTNGDEHIEGEVRYGKFNCGCCNGVYGWYISENPELCNGDIRWLNREEYEKLSLYVKGNIHDNPELLKGGVTND